MEKGVFADVIKDVQTRSSCIVVSPKSSGYEKRRQTHRQRDYRAKAGWGAEAGAMRQRAEDAAAPQRPGAERPGRIPPGAREEWRGRDGRWKEGVGEAGEDHGWWGQDLVRSVQLQSPPAWSHRVRP